MQAAHCALGNSRRLASTGFLYDAHNDRTGKGSAVSLAACDGTAAFDAAGAQEECQSRQQADPVCGTSCDLGIGTAVPPRPAGGLFRRGTGGEAPAERRIVFHPRRLQRRRRPRRDSEALAHRTHDGGPHAGDGRDGDLLRRVLSAREGVRHL